MKPLFAVSLAASAASLLSGCLLTPDPYAEIDKDPTTVLQSGASVLVAGFVPNKSVPIVVQCATSTGPVTLAKFLPSQWPTTDKNAKPMYSFSQSFQVKPECWWRSDNIVGTWEAPKAEINWVNSQLIYAQELTRPNGTKHLSYQNVIAPDRKARQCATDFFATKGTFAAIVNNCSKYVDWNSNGTMTLHTRVSYRY